MTAGILYTFRRCPYAMRARLALDAARIDADVREILLSDKPPEFLQLSPKGTVPVLEVADGPVLEESLDIMKWALAQNDPEDWLKIPRPALHQELLTINDGAFKQHLDRYKYATRYDDADPEQERKAACEFLTRLEDLLSAHRFLQGDRPTLTDAAMFPFVRQFTNVEPDRTKQEFPHVGAWLAHWQSSDRFCRIMRKVPVWEPSKPPVRFSEVFGP